MEQLIAVIVFFALATVIMGLSLHFSKYKQKENSCCGGGHCASGSDGNAHSCYSSKSEFVDNYKKVELKKIEIK